MATPNGKLALALMLVRLPVVCQIMASFFSRKSRGAVPQEVRPEGCTPCVFERSRKNCSASTTRGSSKFVLLPSALARRTPLAVVSPVNSQEVLPSDGISSPHCVTLPPESFLVSFFAKSSISCQLVGPLSGSRP